MATLSGFITYRLQVHVGQQRKGNLMFRFNSKKRLRERATSLSDTPIALHVMYEF